TWRRSASRTTRSSRPSSSSSCAPRRRPNSGVGYHARMVRDILELGGSLGFLDEMYDQFQAQPGAVDESWHAVLGDSQAARNGQAARAANGNGHAVARAVIAAGSGPSLARAPMPEADRASVVTSLARAGGEPPVRPSAVTLSPITVHPSVWPLVNAYRS